MAEYEAKVSYSEERLSDCRELVRTLVDAVPTVQELEGATSASEFIRAIESEFEMFAALLHS